MLTKEDIIHILQLKPHSAGGYFRRTHENLRHPDEDNDLRAPSLSYYLLELQGHPMFHSFQSDETWMYHYGDPLDIYLLSDWEESGEPSLEIHTLGIDLVSGQRPQFTVPANRIFGVKHTPFIERKPGIQDRCGFTLTSCSIRPEFFEESLRLYTREDIDSRYGQIHGLKYFFE